MRSILVGVAISAPALTGQAFAQDTGFYVGGELGATIGTETDQIYVPGTTAGTTGNATTDHELGLSGSAFAGYDFGMFRLEAEAGYVAADFDEITTTGLLLPGGTPPGTSAANGEVNAQLYMANAMIDFGGFQDFAFFAGGGAGVAKLKISEMTAGSSSSIILEDEDADWRSAWQLFAGVRKPLTANIDAHVRYRYLDMGDAEMVGYGGRAVDVSTTTHRQPASRSTSDACLQAGRQKPVSLKARASPAPGTHS